MSPRRQQLTLEPEAPVWRQTPPLHTGPIDDPLLIRIPLELIDTSPLNPRQRFDEEQLQELAASLATDGQLQPVVLRPIGAGKDLRYSIVAGERRYRAAQLLGWRTIASTVRPELDERAHVRIAMIENLARSDLNAVEEARGYKQLLDLGMTQEEIAEAVHRSRPAVANALRLLEAPEPVLSKVEELGPDGKPKLSPSHVLPLLRYKAFPDVVVKLAEVATERRTPSKDLEKGFAELGYEFTHALTESKLAVEVATYRAEFDVQKVCGACPFGAYVAGQYTSYCLRPEHFRQLQKESRAAKKAEVEAAVEQASAGGATVLKLSSLKYGHYERLDYHYGRVPTACTPKCECRVVALDGANHEVKVCRNPARFRQLEQEQRRQEERDRKTRMEDLSDRCGQVLVGADQVRSRELALLAAALTSGLDEKMFKAILAKHRVELKSKRSGAIDFESLARLDPLTLVKVAVEALLSTDISRVSYRAEARFATWYAGPAPKAEKPSRRGKTKPTTTQPDLDRLNEGTGFQTPRLPDPEATMAAIGAEELHEVLQEVPA